MSEEKTKENFLTKFLNEKLILLSNELAKICPDYVHMLSEIPERGKQLADIRLFANTRYKYWNREFC